MKHFKNFFFIISVFLLLAGTPSCSLLHPSANKKARKIQKQQEKSQTKAYNKAKKEHYDRQAESTKKLMKEAKKQQRRANKIHRRSLRARLFRNKCSKRK